MFSCGVVWSAEPEVKLDVLLERGQGIYAKMCADCHGAAGEGVAGVYDDPLIGDASVGELAKVIGDRMPEGEPKACVGPDAAAVAAYVHHTFYSEAARIRNRPPRIMLSRLTGNQLRQSLADLYGRFAGSMWNVNERGLKGTYFDGARWKKENIKIERVDPTLSFDFQNDGPGSGIKKEDFYINWQGALKVDETGEYEIVVNSTCAFLCFLGANDREFINNRVQSGDKTEFRRSITLTAGRVYPLRIEFFQRKRKTEQPPARISLAWVPPGGVEEVIPARHLLPSSAPTTFSLQVKLPPDDRSYGYERGLAVDRQWDASTTSSAVEFAEIATSELWPRYQRDHKRDSNENRAQLRTFLEKILETAFRGPIDDATRTFYIDRQVDVSPDDAEAIKRSLLAALKSPRFLYPGLDTDRSQSQQAANRLALTLFDSLPTDEWLLKLVKEGKLKTPDEIRQAAHRMVGDYRTRGKTRALLYEWLNLGHVGEINKDSSRFPDFDEELVADLKGSLDAFLEEVVWSDSSDYRQLFLADWSFTSDRLKGYYGPAWARRDMSAEDQQVAVGLTRSVADGSNHAGLLTHPYLMSGLAYRDSTSPIHRGVFLIRYMLGRTLRPPAEAFTPLSPDLHPDMTTRERVHLQTSPADCRVCHIKINGLGFTLENFDAVGRFRRKEKEKDIDPTGRYTTRAGQEVEFKDYQQLAEFLANGDDAHQAFVNRAFQYFVKQPIAAYGPNRLEELTATFKANNYRIRDLLVEIAVIAATPPQKTEE